MWVGVQRHAPAALAPGMTQYPLCRRLGRPQGRSGRVRKISPPPGFDPRTLQPVASRYTDWAIPAHNIRSCDMKCFKLFVSIRRYDSTYHPSFFRVVNAGRHIYRQTCQWSHICRCSGWFDLEVTRVTVTANTFLAKLKKPLLSPSNFLKAEDL